MREALVERFDMDEEEVKRRKKEVKHVMNVVQDVLTAETVAKSLAEADEGEEDEEDEEGEADGTVGEVQVHLRTTYYVLLTSCQVTFGNWTLCNDTL